MLYALQEDNKQKVLIKGDSALLNYKTGVNIFKGNVIVDQGTTHVTADRLVTKNNNQHKIREAIAYGISKPAHYWTLPKLGDHELHAHAKVIKFYPIDSKVTLEQKAIVTQGDNSFQGEIIFYNMGDQTVNVPATKGGRAVMIFDPDKQ